MKGYVVVYIVDGIHYRYRCYVKNLQNFVSQYTEHDAVQLILADREDYIPTIIEADRSKEK